MEDDKERGICHVPGPGEPDDVWWFGFDCAHFHDRAPAMERDLSLPSASYKTLDYVRAECASLARQLAARAGTC